MCLFTLQTCYTLFPSNPTIMFKQPPPLQNALLTLKQLMCLFTPYHLQTCYTLFPSIPTKIILMFKHPLLQNNLLTTKKKKVFSRHTNYKHAATNTYESITCSYNTILHSMHFVICNLFPHIPYFFMYVPHYNSQVNTKIIRGLLYQLAGRLHGFTFNFLLWIWMVNIFNFIPVQKNIPQLPTTQLTLKTVTYMQWSKCMPYTLYIHHHLKPQYTLYTNLIKHIHLNSKKNSNLTGRGCTPIYCNTPMDILGHL